MSEKSIEQLQSENLQNFMEHGPGPRSTYNLWVVARDRNRHLVMLGGLGGCGVGDMWASGKEEDYMDFPGFEEAPERNSWMGFGTPEAREKLRENFERWLSNCGTNAVQAENGDGKQSL